jgi:NADH-quinone oxidoreductase subunit N
VTPFNPASLLYSSPLLALFFFGLLLVVLEAFTVGDRRSSLMPLTVVAGVIVAILAGAMAKVIGPRSLVLFDGMLVADRLAMVFTAVFAVITALVAMTSAAHQDEHDWRIGEYYGILLLAASGMSMLAMAGDLVTIFLGVELMSIAVYVLTASRRSSRRSAEAAMKYFLMGAFATGFLLYGIALLYGATGTTSLAGIRAGLAESSSSPVFLAGVFMLIVAFGFKVALVPFHMWAPDAYEGAPTPVTGYMAAAVKAAAFVAILRLFGEALTDAVMPLGRMGWASAFAVLAAVTMTIGNIAALRQDNIKRMLAYSSISHAGVILVGIVAVGYGAGGEASMEARSAVVYYLIAYAITTIGAFSVATWIGSRDRERARVDDWGGLAAAYPGAALAMTIFMLSLGGIPPTAGFVGKFVIFKAATQADGQGLMWLVVIGVLNSVISIFYYLRVVMAMYFRDRTGQITPLSSPATRFVIVVSAVAVIWLGILPSWPIPFLSF